MPENEPVSAYLERVRFFMMAKKLKEDHQVAVFLSVTGSKTYGLLRILCTLTKLQHQTLADALILDSLKRS